MDSDLRGRMFKDCERMGGWKRIPVFTASIDPIVRFFTGATLFKTGGSAPDLGLHQINKKADSTYILINSIELKFLSSKTLTVF
ncbi:MAG: hypothetical protein WC295_10245 [Methanoregula sp.]|jgi:hypothetical protein